MPWTGTKPIERLRWVHRDSERVLEMGWTNPETGLVAWQNVPEFVADGVVMREEPTGVKARVGQLIDQIKFMLDEIVRAL